MRYIVQNLFADRFTVIDTLDGAARLFPTCVLNATAVANTLNQQEAGSQPARSR
jgi:hypothetical protein